jgi:trans-2,3-dihydro-3-hydroxyanthranilate isomerase
MPHRFHIVDVFAEARYAGNPLAVLRDAGDLDAASMQAIAREFGFSETTFLVDGAAAREGGVAVRIFTPAQELPFAGHPTLGTAFVIREERAPARPREVALALGVGRVPVAFEPEPGGSEVAWLSAPPVTLGRKIDAARIAPALGLAAPDVAGDLPVQHARVGVEFVLVPLASRAALARAQLDLAAFAPLAAEGFPKAVYLFARDAPAEGSDLSARMLFDAAGLHEDPATGSATACLGAYLHAHGGSARDLGLRILQGVEMRRPSLLRLELKTGGRAGPRIRVGGRVLETARGELL